jgi:hypothetical protein
MTARTELESAIMPLNTTDPGMIEDLKALALHDLQARSGPSLHGLDQAQAQLRLKKYGYNKISAYRFPDPHRSIPRSTRERDEMPCTSNRDLMTRKDI